MGAQLLQQRGAHVPSALFSPRPFFPNARPEQQQQRRLHKRRLCRTQRAAAAVGVTAQSSEAESAQQADKAAGRSTYRWGGHWLISTFKRRAWGCASGRAPPLAPARCASAAAPSRCSGARRCTCARKAQAQLLQGDCGGRGGGGAGGGGGWRDAAGGGVPGGQRGGRCASAFSFYRLFL